MTRYEYQRLNEADQELMAPGLASVTSPLELFITVGLWSSSLVTSDNSSILMRPVSLFVGTKAENNAQNGCCFGERDGYPVPFPNPNQKKTGRHDAIGLLCRRGLLGHDLSINKLNASIMNNMSLCKPSFNLYNIVSLTLL